MDEKIEKLRQKAEQLLEEEKFGDLLKLTAELTELEKGSNDAIKALNKAIDNYPGDEEARDLCGKAYSALGFTLLISGGNRDDAFRYCRMALKCDPTRKDHSPLDYITSQISAIHGLEGEKKVEAFEIYCDLGKGISFIQDSLFYKKEEPEIAHYTSLHTLKNLSQTEGRFRLYNAAYMNDQEEGQVFFKIAKEVKDMPDIEKVFYQVDEGQIDSSSAYIGSFVRIEDDDPDDQKDKLFLWRTYGRHDAEEAAGACLIFEREDFAKDHIELFGHMPQLKTQLYPYNIHYKKENTKEERANQLNKFKLLVDPLNRIKEFIDEQKEVKEEVKNVKNELKQLVCELLDSIRFLFKEKYYIEEQEVRVIRLHYGGEDESSESEIKTDVDSIPPRFYLEAPKDFRFSEVILGRRATRVQEWRQWINEQSKEQDRKIDVQQSKIPY